ncbi:MAG: hypothetical protein OER88_13270, partial [Planctomycetota bacterium]|nr:hypothetical protein [Planctomycetota bacterium]
TLLEEAAARIDAALDSELTLEEAPLAVSVATLARRERKLFDGLVSFDGRIDKTPPAPLDVGPLRRRLRRAILDHEGGPFPLSVRDGVLRFGDEEVGAAAAPAPAGVARSDDEPPEVKRALDLRETAPDPGLAAFLLVKAVDEALFFYLEPRLRGHELVERARSLPQRPGKRNAVRPEAVHRPVAGWDDTEAARAAEKLAARRAGPEWARIPRGAYVLRLFLSDDDELAADLLSLGRALRRLEKGEAVDGTDAPAERALANLIGLLG